MIASDKTAGLLFSRLSLAWQFAVAGAVVLVVGMVFIGLWVTSRIELASADALSDGARKTLTQTVQQGALSTRLFSFKIWRTDGTIVFSSEPSLIGRQFEVSEKLASASSGAVHAEFDELHSEENRIERESRIPLLEIYSPIREHETHSRGRVEARIAPASVSSQAAKICIYRFILEALSNAARHAKASRISVVMVVEGDGMVEICVEDDEVGFVRRPDDRGLGLAGLEERGMGLGGQLDIASTGAGTALRMRIPANDAEHA